jgi:hypothetical protein
VPARALACNHLPRRTFILWHTTITREIAMRRHIFPLFMLLTACFCLGASKPGEAPDYIKELTATQHLIILASSRDFPALKRQAQFLSAKIHLPFSLRGMIFDPKRGLILPDNDPDDMWAGFYAFRRYNETDINGKDARYLSIEKSDAYPGLKPGYYILLAGIYDNQREASKVAAAYRNAVPDLMIRKTTIYMGCMH